MNILKASIFLTILHNINIIFMVAYHFISWKYHKLFNWSHMVKHLGMLLFLSKIDIWNQRVPMTSFNHYQLMVSLISSTSSPIPHFTLIRRTNTHTHTHTTLKHKTIITPQKLTVIFHSIEYAGSVQKSLISPPFFPPFPLSSLHFLSSLLKSISK